MLVLSLIGLTQRIPSEALAEDSDSPSQPLQETRTTDLPAEANDWFSSLVIRDEQFDNITIEAERSWIESIDAAAWVAEDEFNAPQLPSAGRLKNSKPLPPPYEQMHRVVYKMTVRGAELTIEGGSELEEIKHPEFTMQAAKNLKWTTAGGGERVYDEGTSGESSTLHVNPAKNPMIELHRMRIEFAHGYGFAKRMQGIKTFRIDGNRVFCSGPIHISVAGDDDSQCELELDSDLVVRRAMITTIKGGGISRIVVETSGTKHLETTPPVAERGHFVREISNSRTGRDESGERRFLSENDDRFRFLSLVAGLNDDQYADITTIKTDSNTSTIIHGQPRIVPLGAPKELPPVGENGQLLLILNAIVLAVIAIALLIRRRQRGR